MANNGFAKTLIEILLSWMRVLTSWVWNFFQADMAGGFLNWFADNWIHIAIVLIIIGLVVDWLIWMIRWRPYWLWLRKRQIIYEEVEAPKKRRPERPEPVRHMPKAAPEMPKAAPQAEYDDPFASGEVDPYAARTPAAKAAEAEEEWDAQNDPYAAAAGESPYARPRSAGAANKQD